MNSREVFLLFVVATLLSACSLLPWWARVNEEGGKNQTLASVELGTEALQDGMFVGLALSGGGSRAANFGAAVMFELADLGLLEKIDVVSSVSGGSIPAAYYALHGSRGIAFDRRQVDERFGRDFQVRWLARWFDPRNFLRYWITAFDRSDIMVQVFEANLFHGATFDGLSRNLGHRPRVLINASNTVNGRKFVFDNGTFDRLRSNLGEYPVARAVMASGAFPGAFANVTLQDYRFKDVDRYVHLFDAGPIDNLGVGTLVTVLQRHIATRYVERQPGQPLDLLQGSGFPRGCLIISVDAYTAGLEVKKRGAEADTRPWYGFIVDTNFIDAMDNLLAVKRNEVLHEMGLERENQDYFGSFPLFGLNLDDGEIPVRRGDLLRKLEPRLSRNGQSPGQYAVDSVLRQAAYCHVWHISISQMPPVERHCPLGALVNGIGTWYRIGRREQCGLFEAARTLVRTTWREGEFGRLIREGLPTTKPVSGGPFRLRHPLDLLNCAAPGNEDGASVCRITLSGAHR